MIRINLMQFLQAEDIELSMYTTLMLSQNRTIDLFAKRWTQEITATETAYSSRKFILGLADSMKSGSHVCENQSNPQKPPHPVTPELSVYISISWAVREVLKSAKGLEYISGLSRNSNHTIKSALNSLSIRRW